MRIRDIFEDHNEQFTPEEAVELMKYIMGLGGQFLDQELDYKLFSLTMHEMPYGIAKARTGTPDEWYVEYFDRMGVKGTIDWIMDNTTGIENLVAQRQLATRLQQIANQAR